MQAMHHFMGTWLCGIVFLCAEKGAGCASPASGPVPPPTSNAKPSADSSHANNTAQPVKWSRLIRHSPSFLLHVHTLVSSTGRTHLRNGLPQVLLCEMQASVWP